MNHHMPIRICKGVFLVCFTLVMLTYASILVYVEILQTQETTHATFTADTYGDSITAMGSTYGAVTNSNAQRNADNNYQPFLYQYLRTRSIQSVLRNFGVGGELVHEICDRIRYAPSLLPNVILMAGTNDVLSGTGSNSSDNFQNIISQFYDVTSKYKDTQFFICSIPPLSSIYATRAPAVVRANTAIQTFTEKTNNTVFCDIHAHLSGFHHLYFQNAALTLDGIHLTRQGNEILGQAIGSCIVKHYYKWTTNK